MLKIVRTNSKNFDFSVLVKKLDRELSERDGNEHLFYSQHFNTEALKHVIVVYNNGILTGCGAIKELDATCIEVKRMFVIQKFRGMGIARNILAELEKWSTEMGFEKCVLETGKRQPEAIGLYKNNGYSIISNYGPYVGIENSICFEKLLDMQN